MDYNEYLNLIQKLKKWEYEYHCLDDPSVDDIIYDIEFKKLKAVEEENIEWITSDSPSQKIGGIISGDFPVVQHEIPMLSLSNAINGEEREKFLSENNVDKDKKIYTAEVKLDGLAISLIYKKGILVQAATRGTGTEGEDVTLNVKTIKNVPHQLLGDYPDEIEIRGEVVMPKSGFNKLNRECEENGIDPFKTSRNAAAGSLRNKDTSVTAKRPIAFYAYSLGLVNGGDMPENHFDCLDKIKEFGLMVPKEVKLVSANEIEQYYTDILEDRNNLEYDIDGVVIKINSFSEQEELGFISKAPKWAKAFKFPSATGITELLDVIYQTGRTGAVTPVAILKPVDISGATFARATLHNVDELKRLGIMIGDKIVLKRAQDVIPKVVSVVFEDRDLDKVKSVVFPTSCPVCNSPLIKEDDKAVTRCTGGLLCSAQLKGGIEHFASKKAVNIHGCSDKLIDTLVESGLVSTITDLYKLTVEDLLTLDRMADKSANKIFKSIEKSKNSTLGRVLFGIGIREVGESTAKNLANYFGNLDKLKMATYDELLEVTDIGTITAQYIVDYFNDERNIELIEDLQNSGLFWEDISQDTGNKPLKGKTIVLTGTFYDVKRTEIKERLEKLGAKVSGSVSKNTSFLVYGDKAGGKLEKASDLGITSFNEEEFLPQLFELEKPANPVESFLEKKNNESTVVNKLKNN